MYYVKGVIFSAILLGSLIAIPFSVNAAPELTQPKDDVALSVRFGGGYGGPYYRGRRYYRSYPGYYGNYRYRYQNYYPYGAYYYRGYNPYYYGSGGRVYFNFGR